MTSKRIAVLGAGVIGETLLAAIFETGYPAEDVVISEKLESRAADVSQRYGVEAVDGPTAVDGADVVLIAVKPHDVLPLLAAVGERVKPDAVVVSLAAGIRISDMAALLPTGVGIVRVMPNTPAAVRQGMFGVSPSSATGAERLDATLELLALLGRVVVIDEPLQDAVTSVSGSGPAYVFYLAEAMIAGGVAGGLDESTARLLTVQTLTGAAALLAGSEEPPEALRAKVTSPNGATRAAVETFDAHGVRDGLVAGVRAAAARSAELAAPAHEVPGSAASRQ